MRIVFSRADADPQEDEAITPAALEAIQQFLAHTLGLSPRTILKAADSLMGGPAIAHFLVLGEEANEQYPAANPLATQVVPESA